MSIMMLVFALVGAATVAILLVSGGTWVIKLLQDTHKFRQEYEGDLAWHKKRLESECAKSEIFKAENIDLKKKLARVEKAEYRQDPAEKVQE